MEFLLALAFLACPVGMGLMMWFMAKGMRKEPAAAQPQGAPGAAEQPHVAASVEQLREEHRRLGAELERIDGEAGASVAGRS